MQIQLVQNDIEKALRNYVQENGIDLENATVDISFGRKKKYQGVTVNLDIQHNEEFQNQTVENTSYSESNVFNYNNQKTESEAEFTEEVVEEVEEVEETKGPLFGN